jgi:uncharacterized membrane protein HdeD (DUF308 family)
MVNMLARNWWVLALRGLFAIIFGVLAFAWPGVTLATLVLLFGAYALVDGVFSVIEGISSYGERERWWAVLLEGLASIAIGLITFFWPDVTALVLLYFIAAWAIITGVLEIIAAIQLRRVITGEWLMILSGLASIVFGVLLVVFPGAGALGLLWLIAAYAIVFGVLMIILAFRLRGMREEGVEKPAERVART